MLYVYLDSSGMCWSKLGIDILLGSKIDKPVTIEQSNFLPDYLMFAFDSSNLKHKIIEDKRIYKAYTVNNSSKNNYQPLIIFSLLFLFVLIASFSKNRLVQNFYHYSSLFFVFITGIMGVVLLFMWFGTDHKSCSYNYNLLWALPTNFIAAFVANRERSYRKSYFRFAFIVTSVLLASWFFLPQQFNISLIPFVIMMTFIYRKLSV
jgi:hypothetical protein